MAAAAANMPPGAANAGACRVRAGRWYKLVHPAQNLHDFIRATLRRLRFKVKDASKASAEQKGTFKRGQPGHL